MLSNMQNKVILIAAITTVFFSLNSVAGNKSSSPSIPKQFQGHWALTSKDCDGSNPGADFYIESSKICYEDGCDKVTEIIASSKYKFVGYFCDRRKECKVSLELNKGKLLVNQGSSGGESHVRCK